MTSYLYQWRYQIPTDVARRQPEQMRSEARKAAVRDAHRDGWVPAAPPLVNAYEAYGLDNVTDLVVTFAVNERGAPQAVHDLPEVEKRLPAGPLVELVDDKNLSEIFTKTQMRAYTRGRRFGVFTLRMADELSLAAGFSIESVWPSSDASHTSPMMGAATEGAA